MLRLDSAAPHGPARPQLNRAYSDAFDGQTDLSAALLFEELAEVYPDARFVYTTRPAAEWARAMVRFACTEPRRALFRSHPVASAVYSAACVDFPRSLALVRSLYPSGKTMSRRTERRRFSLSLSLSLPKRRPLAPNAGHPRDVALGSPAGGASIDWPR